MNRTEEYWALMQELSAPPPALDGTVERARARARRRLRNGRLWTIPAASLASLAACFVLLVNVFPTFALACSHVPLLRELAAAVAFSPSLSAAVEHDCVQYIGQTQTVDGVTLTLEYAIADEKQLTVFYRLDGPWVIGCDLLDRSGQPLEGYGVTMSNSAEGYDTLRQFNIHFSELSPPEELTLSLTLHYRPDWYNPTPPDVADLIDRDDGSFEEYLAQQPSVSFTFPLTLDPSRTAEAVTLPVGQWLELDGQRILVDRLELTPTRTILYLDSDPANDKWLRQLRFWFEDAAGNRYENGDGILSSTGEPDTPEVLTYYWQSFYFDRPEGLTLCVDTAVWQEKEPEAQWASLDLLTRTAAGLPEGCTLQSVQWDGDDVTLWINSDVHRNPFSGAYRDPEGNSYELTRMGLFYDTIDSETLRHIPYCYTFTLENYPWDTVELQLDYDDYVRYEQPVTVPIS